MEKQRLDVLMVEKGLAPSREKAKALIMAGDVYIKEVKYDKAGQLVDVESEITLRRQMPYVSRGGFKLEKAMQTFPIELQGKVCMDIGASTGGFTDCMLQNGAVKVYSIDVGYGQLAWKLRTDERVINLERTNIRYITEEQIPQPVDFMSIDVSFISLRLVLPAIKPFLKPDGAIAALIKPQFEAGREKVGKKGVVRDPKVHEEVIQTIYNFVLELGWIPAGLTYSPIRGPEGNIEYLIYIKQQDAELISEDWIAQTVRMSHEDLES